MLTPDTQVVVLKRDWFDRTKSIIWMIVGIFFVFTLVGLSISAEPTSDMVVRYYDEDLLEIDEGIAMSRSVQLAYVDLQGVIMVDSMADVSTFGAEPVITPEEVAWQISTLTDGVDPISGVLIHLSTPGGMVAPSNTIARMVQKLAEQMPVYVYTDDIMASGGYYIAAHATKILAHKEAEVGSIGVIYQIPNIQELSEEKIGLTMETYKSGPLKDLNNPFRDRTEEEKQIILQLVNDSYAEFLSVVSTGRNMTLEEVQPLATGQVWRGVHAKQGKLIDETLYPDEVVPFIKNDMNIADESVVLLQYDTPPLSLFEEFGLVVKSSMASFNPLQSMGQKILNKPAGLYYEYTR